MTLPIDPAQQRLAYDVPLFCRLHNISKGMFYIMHKNETGPEIMKIGSSTLISAEAATKWRARMTELTASGTTE